MRSSVCVQDVRLKIRTGCTWKQAWISIKHNCTGSCVFPEIQKWLSVLPLLWTLTHLKWSETKWKTVLWLDQSKLEITFENHGHHVLWTKKEWSSPAFFFSCREQFKGLHLWWYEVAFVSMVWAAYTSAIQVKMSSYFPRKG